MTISANNATIKNCICNSSGYFTIGQLQPYNGLTVQNCTFVGTKSTTSENDDFIFSEGNANTITNNVFLNTSIDAIWIAGGTISNNYIGPGGYWPGGHADGITIAVTRAPVTIQNNYIDWSDALDGKVHTNNAINITAEGGNISDVTVSGNVLLGGGYTILASFPSGGSIGYSISDIKITNNMIGRSGYGPLYPVKNPNFIIFSGNVNFDSGAKLPNINAPGNMPTIDLLPTDRNLIGPGIAHQNTLRLTGTAAANSIVKIFDGTTQLGMVKANVRGAWSFTTAALANGSHSFTVTATSGGTTSPASAPLSVKVNRDALRKVPVQRNLHGR